MKPASIKSRYAIEITDVDPTEDAIQEAIWKLLVLIDHEFIPPLSTREGTTTMMFNSSKTMTAAGPRAYFENILEQKIIMAQVGGDWVGFLSFQHNYRLELLGGCNPCNYLTTIGVSPYFRNIGIAKSMYQFILNDLIPELQSPYWATRTWSTNNDHLRLLNKIGFSHAVTFENHRGDGIDTVYYVYQMPVHLIDQPS
jgi:hypothetical protein